MSTGWVWHERYAWHDARGLTDSLEHDSLFEPQPSLESGVVKRRLRNLVDASGLLAQLTEIPATPMSADELSTLHDRAYVERVRAESADRGGDAGSPAWRAWRSSTGTCTTATGRRPRSGQTPAC
jgi:acetoin utilization deacetylase AcuC-like enzyme